MQILQFVVILGAVAVGFVLTQHGLGNTLKSIGIAFLNAGTAHEKRVAERREQVTRDMLAAMEAAGERA